MSLHTFPSNTPYGHRIRTEFTKCVPAAWILFLIRCALMSLYSSGVNSLRSFSFASRSASRCMSDDKVLCILWTCWYNAMYIEIDDIHLHEDWCCRWRSHHYTLPKMCLHGQTLSTVAIAQHAGKGLENIFHVFLRNVLGNSGQDVIKQHSLSACNLCKHMLVRDVA